MEKKKEEILEKIIEFLKGWNVDVVNIDTLIKGLEAQGYERGHHFMIDDFYHVLKEGINQSKIVLKYLHPLSEKIEEASQVAIAIGLSS